MASYTREEFIEKYSKKLGVDTPVRPATTSAKSAFMQEYKEKYEAKYPTTEKGQTYSAPVVVQPRVATPEEIAQRNAYYEMQKQFAKPSVQTQKKGFLDQADNFVKGINLMGNIYAASDVLGNTIIEAARNNANAEYQYKNLIAPSANATPEEINAYYAQLTDIAKRTAISTPLDSYIAARTQDVNTREASQLTKAYQEESAQARESFKEGKGTVGEFLADAAFTGADLAADAALSATTGVPLNAIMGITSGANVMQTALDNGADYSKAALLGIGAGGITAGVEGLGGIAGSWGDEAFETVLKSLPPKAADYVSKLSGTKLFHILGSGFAEAGEEGLEYDLQRVWQNLILDEDTPRDVKEQLYSMALGGVVGAGFGTITPAKGRNDVAYTTDGNIAADTNDGTNNVENSAENAIISTENVAKPTENVAKPADTETADRKELEDEVKRIVGIDTRTEAEKVADTENERIALAEEMAAIAGAPQSDVERVRQSAEENIAEAKAKESLESAVELIRYAGKEEDIYSDSKDKAAAYNTAKRIGINLAHSGTTAMARAVHEVGHDKTQSEQWQNYTAALDRLIATDGRLVKLMDDIDYAYRNSEDTEVRASVSFENGTINNAKIREEQYLKLTEIMLPNIAKGDKQLLDAIKKDRNVIDNLLDFIRGIKNKVSIKLTKSEAAMLDEAERQLVNLLRSEGTQTEGKQYSYGGTRAANPPEGFLRADRLAEFGTDNEEIRQETGWFKGADGKWRFEIDDSKAVVSYKGDLEQNKNPEYREYQDLFNALYIEMEDRSDEDFERFKVLDKKFSNSKKDLRLKDYMQHDELYRYYPQIAEIPVAKIKGSSNGKYDGLGIQINESLLRPGYEKQFKETLLHEVQHIIQETEGFARGASTKYWTGKEGNTGKTARELYLNTAGEQESRDVEKRMNYTAEQRRAEKPFTGNENTVFVDGERVFESVIDHIIGASGKDYGKGVYLDSGYLEGLTEAEQKTMVAERVKELGGQPFTAYNNNGEPVAVKIAGKYEKFVNQKGKKRNVNHDLATKNRDNAMKRQAVVVSDELLEAADFIKKEPAKHPHDWLDNNGLNAWDVWTVFIQEKNNSVWSADLKIANSTNGEKYLYDIVNIKKVEANGNSLNSPLLSNIPQTAENNNGNNLSKNSGRTFSIAMDSSGNKLTEKQADYFKNSVARDSQGRLLTLYHQTNADFTEFNIKSTGAGRYDDAMPDGVFLKPTSADIGLKGKKQMALYANITNPLQFRDRGEMARYWKRNIEGYADVQKQIEDTDTQYKGKYDAADLLEDEQYKKIRKQLINKEITAEQFRELLKETETKKILAEWTATSNDLRAKAKELINGYIADNDFDGIILENDAGSFGRNVKSYVVFNSNQVKNTDNTTPTKNADIRYSLQSDIDTNEYWGENSKSRAVERHAVNEFASAVADLMGVEFKDKNEILKKQAWKIAKEGKETGLFDMQRLIDYFEKAYDLGKQEVGNLDQRNKQLKKELHNLGIKPLKGREYLDFVQKYQNKIRFSHKGTDIDIIYKELAENYPEWFSEDIVNPYNMMRRIGEVYDSIQGKKVSNKEFWGQDAEKFKSLAVQQYQAIVDNFIDTMNSVSRYQLALADQKRQEEAATKKVYTVEDVKAARELAQPLMKEIARMDRKNMFTAEDRTRLNEMLKLSNAEDVNRMQENLRQTNPLAEDIIAMYDKKKMLEAVQKPIFEYNKQRKARLKSQFLDILQTSDSWKDKGSGLAYMNNTFERNIDDIVTDKKAAEKLKDILPRQIHKHVADATRYKNKLRDKIRGFNINTEKKYNIKVWAAEEWLEGEATEADLIQMYGEGIVTKQYLDQIGADTKKIVETADKFREIYNELFEKINDAYVTNGYAPMEYRQDYFPHFFDETGDTLLNKVGAFLGIDAKNMLPTEIAGRTHEFSPGRQWNSHALQRKGEKTDYNVLKGFDNYIEAAANIIHLTEDIQNLRAFENAIRYKYSDEGMKAEIDAIDALPVSEEEKQDQRKKIFKTENRNTKLNNFVVWEHEYTNLLAGKKSKADRWIEDMFGRRFYTVAKNIENRVSANMIAGNISSALTNFIPLTQLTAEVDGRYIATAMSDTIKNMKNNDSFVDMSDFLTNRFGSEMLSLTTMQKLANKAGAPMALVDEFTSNVVTRARYLQNVDKNNMDSGSAIKEADEYAASLMADRSKGALPTIFESKNPLIKLFTMFQVEQANQLNYLFKDLPRKKQDKAKNWLLWALIKLGVFSFLYNWLFEQIAGRKPAFSPVDMVVDTSKDIKQVAKGEMKASAALSDSFVRTMENLPYASSVLAVTGLSEDAGRIPVSGALPDFSQLAYLMDRDVSAEKKKAVAMKELTKPALYLATPFAGGQAKKVVDAGVLYGKNKGVQYSIQSDGSKKVQFANDTGFFPFMQAAAFGKWASKPAQEYIDSGFKGLTKGQTENFELYKSWGMSNKEAFAKAKASKAMTDKQVSDMEKLVKSGAQEKTAYNLVTTYKAEADKDKNGSLKQSEAVAYLDGLSLTREQKAILFSCMCPKVKNNPYR